MGRKAEETQPTENCETGLNGVLVLEFKTGEKFELFQI
jgi:hypothetical protein